MGRTEQPPLAFIYDRKTTPTETALLQRVQACRERAATHGYELAGDWIEQGNAALSMTSRPTLDALLLLMRTHARQRPVLCLISDWNRLANDREPRAVLQRRIRGAGGWTETAVGESDREPPRGILNHAAFLRGLNS